MLISKSNKHTCFTVCSFALDWTLGFGVKILGMSLNATYNFPCVELSSCKTDRRKRSQNVNRVTKSTEGLNKRPPLTHVFTSLSPVYNSSTIFLLYVNFLWGACAPIAPLATPLLTKRLASNGNGQNILASKRTFNTFNGKLWWLRHCYDDFGIAMMTSAVNAGNLSSCRTQHRRDMSLFETSNLLCVCVELIHRIVHMINSTNDKIY